MSFRHEPPMRQRGRVEEYHVDSPSSELTPSDMIGGHLQRVVIARLDWGRVSRAILQRGVFPTDTVLGEDIVRIQCITITRDFLADLFGLACFSLGL